MGPAELLLRHSRLDDRAASVAAEINRLEARLASDPESDRLQALLEEARARLQESSLQLRDRDREREDHRTKMRARQRELMSGRIRNPTELMQMSEEIDHMKARLADEENAELQLMEEADGADAEVRRLEQALVVARRQKSDAEPGLTATLAQSRDQLAELERERDEVWAQVPAPYQHAYRRLRVRPPVAEVSDGNCAACRVAVTSRQMQQLRRADILVNCENCGRILVVA